jgi:lipopolysaccharide export LptBFGC system permease protein LptF
LGEAQIALDTTYEHFLRLSKARRQVDSLFFADLLAMSKDFGNYGYIPQVFQAEIIRRIAEPVILLPLTILAIIIGWRFRAKTAPRYLGFPMLIIIPLVFNGVVHLIRSLTGVLGLALLLSLGFSPAITIFIAGSLLFFILSLIILASQKGE